METPAARLTYDDFVLFPDDGQRHELIDGAHFVSPSPTPLHQRVSGRLFVALREFFQARSIGEVFIAPVDVILGVRDVVVPDLVVVARPSQVSSRGIEGAPLVAVEIVSPSSLMRDRGVKFQRYAAIGIEHYWIVDPDARTIDCYRLERGRFARISAAGGAGVLAHPDFPGLAIALERLWPSSL